MAAKLWSVSSVGFDGSAAAMSPARVSVAVTGKSRMQASSGTADTLATFSGCGSSLSVSSIGWPSVTCAGPRTASTALSSSAMVSVTCPIAAPSAVTAKLTVSASSSRASSTTEIAALTLRCPAPSVRLRCPAGSVQSSVSAAVGEATGAIAIARATPDVPPPATATVSVTVPSSPSTASVVERLTSSASLALSTVFIISRPEKPATGFGVTARSWSRVEVGT